MKAFLISLLLLVSCCVIGDELDEVITLSKSKITPTIIKAYIDGVTNKIDLNATNIVRLKKEGVADDVVLYMLNKKTKVVTNIVERYVVVDPDIDSYQFFKRYYLIPRAEMFKYDLTNRWNRR